MPYYHEGIFTSDNEFKECGGEILFWQRRCKKCSYQWPLRVMFQTQIPIDMSTFQIDKEPSTYAKWAENLPGVPEFASMLPRWPRWARILTSSIFILLAAWFIYFPIHFIWGIGPWFK